MSKRCAVSIVALVAGLMFSPVLRAQIAAPQAAGPEAKNEARKWNNIPPRKSAYTGGNPAPAPRRDLSGIWDAAGLDGGFQVNGAYEHPALFPRKGGAAGSPLEATAGAEGGRPDETGIEHPLPYTPLGLAALKANKPSGPGVRQVPAALSNDPLDQCDPIGFPRMELFELRTFELEQTANKVIYLNEWYGNWRIIWTDGRELPKDPEPRWDGYSVGKWVDDYTFVVETVGLNSRSWLDHAGRPHSADLRIEERFHRVDHDNMELTVTIDDPKMYKEPWMGLNKFPLHLLPSDFDMPELLCSPIDMAEYNRQVADTVAPSRGKKK
jgi:hypothetical protein